MCSALDSRTKFPPIIIHSFNSIRRHSDTSTHFYSFVCHFHLRCHYRHACICLRVCVSVFVITYICIICVHVYEVVSAVLSVIGWVVKMCHSCDASRCTPYSRDSTSFAMNFPFYCAHKFLFNLFAYLLLTCSLQLQILSLLFAHTYRQACDSTWKCVSCNSVVVFGVFALNICTLHVCLSVRLVA